MNKNVLLDSIEKTAHDMAKLTKDYEKFLSRPVGPHVMHNAEKYIALDRIQKKLLEKLSECR